MIVSVRCRRGTASSEPSLLGFAEPGSRVRAHQQERLARLISRSLTGWGGVHAGYLGPRVRGYGDQPQDEQEQQNQQHPEELPNRMPLLCGPRGLRRPRPPDPGSTQGTARWASWAGCGRPGSGSGRAEGTAPASVSLVHVPTGSASRECVPAPPAGGRVRTASRDPRRGPGRHVSKGTWGEVALFCLLSAPDSGARRRGFSTEAAGTAHTGRDLPQVPSPQADRKAS